MKTGAGFFSVVLERERSQGINGGAVARENEQASFSFASSGRRRRHLNPLHCLRFTPDFFTRDMTSLYTDARTSLFSPRGPPPPARNKSVKTHTIL